MPRAKHVLTMDVRRSLFLVSSIMSCPSEQPRGIEQYQVKMCVANSMPVYPVDGAMWRTSMRGGRDRHTENAGMNTFSSDSLIFDNCNCLIDG